MDVFVMGLRMHCIIDENKKPASAASSPTTRCRFVSMDELMPIFREQLDAGRSVRFSPRGVSMLPVIREGIDSVVLSPLPNRLQRYDLPLYRRDNGDYVLHRVVEVERCRGGGHSSANETFYTCMGDNQFVKEHGLAHDQMIAVVTSFYRGDKRYEVSDFRYKLYCCVWYRSRRVRRYFRRCVGFAKRKISSS